MRIFLINPASGQAWHRWRRRALLRAISEHPDARIIETTPDTVSQVRTLLDQRPEAVIACGGDGTVSAAAEALAGTEVLLGIVPCGTTNVLAREFGVPLDPVRAVREIARANTWRPLQTWVTDRGSLVLGAGIGWDARLMHSVPSQVKRRFGFAGMMPTAFRLVVAYDFPELRISGVDPAGAPVTAGATSVIVSNSRYWSGANAAITGADPGDEVLDVVLLERNSIAHLASFWMRMSVPGASPLGLAGVRHLKLRSLTIESSDPPSTEVHLNGEARGHTPISFALGPVVRILNPARGA